MGVSMNEDVPVAPLRVHGLRARMTYTLDNCVCQLRMLLAFTGSDEKTRNTFIVVGPTEAGEQWDALCAEVVDDKTADEIVVWMYDNDLGPVIDKAWSPGLRVVPYE